MLLLWMLFMNGVVFMNKYIKLLSTGDLSKNYYLFKKLIQILLRWNTADRFF